MKTYKLRLADFDYIRNFLYYNYGGEAIDRELIKASHLVEQKYVEIDENFAKSIIFIIDHTLETICISLEWREMHFAWRDMLTKIKKELLK